MTLISPIFANSKDYLASYDDSDEMWSFLVDEKSYGCTKKWVPTY